MREVRFLHDGRMRDRAPATAQVVLLPRRAHAPARRLRRVDLAEGRATTIVLAGASADTVDTITFTDEVFDELSRR